MKQKTGRKLLSFLLTLAMVIGMVPGMSLTALADVTTYNPATDYTGFAELASGDATVQIDGVKYDGTNVADWYVIGYDSNAKTVTLLSKQSFGSKAFNSNCSNGNSYLPVSVTIAKATPTVTAPTATNPTYTGSAQNLITAGTREESRQGEVRRIPPRFHSAIPDFVESRLHKIFCHTV